MNFERSRQTQYQLGGNKSIDYCTRISFDRQGAKYFKHALSKYIPLNTRFLVELTKVAPTLTRQQQSSIAIQNVATVSACTHQLLTKVVTRPCLVVERLPENACTRINSNIPRKSTPTYTLPLYIRDLEICWNLKESFDVLNGEYDADLGVLGPIPRTQSVPSRPKSRLCKGRTVV